MNTPTILIVEDDHDISNLIQLTLQDAGFRTLQAYNGTSGLIQAREHAPDLVLVDLGLPDFGGDEVARRVRATNDVPILILTAIDDPEQKVSLLGVGADDYITKPFHADELVARIRVQFRHRDGAASVTVGLLKLERDKRMCTFADHEVRLSPREFDLLGVLARTPGRVHTREEIARELWGDDASIAANVIDVHVSNLRGKLRDVGAYGVIRTVRGVGFAVKDPAATARAAQGVA
ncbi:response regulator transcription factor, partial [Deinococcus pimensis]|uniref:response regulator transcription factor n=1 Tax=Deinococcus pimensis TaxID=309888 RepID=UPI000A009F63